MKKEHDKKILHWYICKYLLFKISLAIYVYLLKFFYVDQWSINRRSLSLFAS